MKSTVVHCKMVTGGLVLRWRDIRDYLNVVAIGGIDELRNCIALHRVVLESISLQIRCLGAVHVIH